ncbi:carboxypeptidase-like regulatory domain-containing protein [Tenacibaculum mesophilum]|uniref:carboxypeptidase-like regulatory domain-containing protein n=1 Tax=Tenacibaculum mesophilum TaxID=104268 RepID=UPI00064AC771|nr:carboxypeptidase-like regulatory domain-containing protein [Tenacibaculum mesophilum]
MRKLLFIFFIALSLSCKEKRLFYHGVVLDENNRPLPNIEVKELDFNNSTLSDSKGYFKLKKDINFISKLSFSKKGYKTKIVRTVWTHSGEVVGYTFLNKKADTITLKKKAILPLED